MTPESRFDQQRYIVLETYRKSGAPVVTPLGFVRDGALLYVRTTADSGKIKRIRANPRVRVAPGNRNGQALGAWVDATAVLMSNAEADAVRVRARILAKYRLLWLLIETVDSISNRLRGRPQPEWVHLRITLAAQP